MHWSISLLPPLVQAQSALHVCMPDMDHVTCITKHARAAVMQVCVGFGVSRPEHAQQIVAMGAEGVICGSALVKALGESKTPVSSCGVARAALVC